MELTPFDYASYSIKLWEPLLGTFRTLHLPDEYQFEQYLDFVGGVRRLKITDPPLSDVSAPTYILVGNNLVIRDSRDLNGATLPYPTYSVYRAEDLFPPNSPYTDIRLLNIANNGHISAFASNAADQNTTHALLLGHVTIVPDDNMAGVIGDVIKSAKPASTVKHFVTPKKSTELNQDFVELKADGIAAADFDHYFVWENGEEGSAPNKRKVKRDATGTGPTEVKIRNKQDNTVVAQMDVWVVWASCTSTRGNGILDPNNNALRYYVLQTAPWKFVFSIQPAAIINAPDGERPALQGDKRKPVPGDGKPYAVDPLSKQDGDSARLKWDVSRQLKETIENPQHIPKECLAWRPPFLEGQPGNTTLFGWPTGDSAEGNDDPLQIPDEDDDPYHTQTIPPLVHAVGELTSFDWPISVPISNSCGGQGRTMLDEADFREFCRVELWDGTRKAGKFWYRISDYQLWHVAFRAVWSADSEKWVDDPLRPSQTDVGNLHP